MSTERSDTEPLLGKQKQQQYGASTTEHSAESSDSEITIITSTAAVPKPDDTLPSGSNIVFVLMGLWMGVFLSSLDSSIVSTILTRIGSDFNRYNDAVWVATSYLISYTALQPLYGRISDAIGRKNTLLFASSTFFIGSLLCGAAPNFWFLVAARVVAGIGGGGMNTMSSIVTSDLVSLRDRGKYQGYGNLSYALGSVIGGPLGGFITDYYNWRWTFYINLPLLFLTFYVTGVHIKNYNVKREADGSFHYLSKLREVDWVGAVTLVISVALFMLATSLGGNSLPWSHPLVIGSLSGSAAGVILFTVVEAKYAKYPIMPWHIITQRTPLASSFTNFWSLMCSMSLVFLVPLYFQSILGFSASKAGVYMLPKILASSAGSLIAGYYMSHTGRYKGFCICSGISLILGAAIITSWTPQSSAWWMALGNILDGYALGSLLTTTLVSLLAAVEVKDSATIISISYLFRTTGGVLGVSTCQGVFQAVLKTQLVEKVKVPNAAEIIDAVRKSVSVIWELPEDVREMVLEAYLIAIKYAFSLTIVFAVLALVSVSFVERLELTTKVRK
ncbi:hypothetical protein K450DRAFT_219276 [Umbelopsis ramanniana AG]|uniref:Major facilitator superfamily (MFS) profile domain-containing protein n=1 Tax=Umbelopsis ramanniana AG TaxID=1314678 RepID=A0AAD5HH65_UMBRA|nr:uncharacterized protein K450DRAFT_219276 [Umbelopsis ramanniana AG]KAI8584312.1 hypothetical protein K450DRAFT_219276 [Umbelopsis ramanniana AG]